MSDDLERLAAKLRALSEEWGEEEARLMFDRQVAKLSGTDRDRLAVLTFGENSHFGDVNIGSVAGRDISTGSVTISDDATINGLAIGVNLGSVIFGHVPEETERQELVWYLNRLVGKLRKYPLRGLDAKLDEGAQALEMSRIYINAAVRSTIPIAEGTTSELRSYFQLDDVQRPLRSEYHPDTALPDKSIFTITIRHRFKPQHQVSEPGTATLVLASEWPGDATATQDDELSLMRRQMATEVIFQQQQVILLADPGGGKSTLLRYLAWSLAMRGLDQPTCIPLPGWDGTDYTLPIIVPLRRLAHRLSLDKDPLHAVFESLCAVLREERVSKPEHLLQEALYRKKVILLFDGLDEVPVETSSGANRLMTLQSVRDFVHLYSGVRCVLTCRTRAFDRELRATTRWARTTLAPFTIGQIRAFVQAWNQELVLAGQLEDRQSKILSRTLIEAILSSRKLQMMADNPLLLTMMALIIYHDGSLPRDRPLLYERILELLLGQWDKVKEGESLAEAIGQPEWGSERVRPLIDQLSYQAHSSAASEDGRGRLYRSDVRDGLIQFFETARLPEPWSMARRCLDYFEQRSGLIVADGPESYVFAHLTLQEHCAGRHMLLGLDAVDIVMQHRHDDRWFEPILLGLGAIQRTNPALIDRILSDLIDPDESVQPKPLQRRQRDLILAAEIGYDRDWAYLRTQRVNVDRLQRDLRGGLAQLLAEPEQPLPIADRIRAAVLLGELRDHRFPLTLEEWQQEIERAREGDNSGYFCRVEPGLYEIGARRSGMSRKYGPAHTVTITKPYWIGRYLITQSQWEAYVMQGAGIALARVPGPGVGTGPNYPVSGLNWDRCAAFCTWLSRSLSAQIYLPSEVEWEIAARGTGSRQFPWGNAWQADHAATQEDAADRSHTFTPVGCYPAGKSPCGALDMAGNLWEWTSSQWKSYPASTQPFSEPDRHTIRGGGHTSRPQRVCCFVRDGDDPLRSPLVTGFRVRLVLPASRKR